MNVNNFTIINLYKVTYTHICTTDTNKRWEEDKELGKERITFSKVWLRE